MLLCSPGFGKAGDSLSTLLAMRVERDCNIHYRSAGVQHLDKVVDGYSLDLGQQDDLPQRIF